MLLLSPFCTPGSTLVSGASPASHMQLPTSSSQIALCPALLLLAWSFLTHLAKMQHLREGHGRVLGRNKTWSCSNSRYEGCADSLLYLSIFLVPVSNKSREQGHCRAHLFFVVNPVELLRVCNLPEERSGMIHSAKKRNKYWNSLGEYVCAALHCTLQLWSRVWMLSFLTLKGWQCVT